jgi:hypothetical protein
LCTPYTDNPKPPDRLAESSGGFCFGGEKDRQEDTMEVKCIKCGAIASSQEAALADHWAIIGTVSEMFYFCPEHKYLLASYVREGTWRAQVDRDLILDAMPEMPLLEPGEPYPDIEIPEGLERIDQIISIGSAIANSLDGFALPPDDEIPF